MFKKNKIVRTDGRNYQSALKQQRLITVAIKQARILSLLPFINTATGVKIKKLTARARNKVKSDGRNKSRPREAAFAKTRTVS